MRYNKIWVKIFNLKGYGDLNMKSELKKKKKKKKFKKKKKKKKKKKCIMFDFLVFSGVVLDGDGNQEQGACSGANHCGAAAA